MTGPHRPAADATERSTHPRPRVLCVDDEPLVLAGLARTLRVAYDVRTAVGGRAGVAALTETPDVAVVVSDLRMPDLDGPTFLASARRIAPDATRVVLTGQADLPAAIAAVNEGQVFRFLLKSITSPILRSVIAAAVAQHRLVSSERRTREAALLYRATHDALTGLRNRDGFRTHTAAVLAERDADRVALLLVDVDDFQVLNERFGHAAGDALLRAAGGRLRDAAPGGALVARVGGNQFAVLLDDVADASAAARAADDVGAALAAPIDADGHEIRMSASVGVARATTTAGADNLLRDADLALSRAKAEGRGRVATFVPALRDALLERDALTSDLRRAVERLTAGGAGGREAEFTVVYQPIVELASGRLAGAEALLRWQHPERGPVGPATFIPLAEQAGLIVRIGRWVLGEACREAARWAADGAAGRVCVNVSAIQLHEPTFADDVAAALRAADLPPHLLLLELTESVLVRDGEATLERLHALKRLGIAIAIDDFGTGYSSLVYLQRLPVDVLKIDKAFVDHVGRGEPEAVLARTIVALGTALGLRCVAEGVEHDEQRLHLAQLGCSWGQGYLFDRPLPARDIAARFAAGRARL